MHKQRQQIRCQVKLICSRCSLSMSLLHRKALPEKLGLLLKIPILAGSCVHAWGLTTSSCQKHKGYSCQSTTSCIRNIRTYSRVSLTRDVLVTHATATWSPGSGTAFHQFNRQPRATDGKRQSECWHLHQGRYTVTRASLREQRPQERRRRVRMVSCRPGAVGETALR
jgi:hypothetical protein